MHDIDCHFRFNPVGQALFYSGSIGSFGFVYDCGGKKACIDREIARLPQQPLDLLIISHMHQDHVSGVRALVDHTGGVNRVVLPYLEPTEILLAAGEYLASGGGTSPEDDFIHLLRNPAEFFGTETTISRIGNAQDESRSNEDYTEETFGWSGADQDSVRGHSQQLRSKLWFFRFFHERIAATQLNRFKTALQNSGIDPEDTAIDIIANSQALKSAYNSVAPRGNLNRTSLLCIHGPRKRAWEHYFWHPGFMPGPWFTRFPGATLLTGDADFTKCFDSFVAHFSEEVLNSVCWASVPHHGSRHNWRDELFCVLPNCYYWICTCRAISSNHHPHKAVLRSFFHNYPVLYPCTESRSFDYNMILHGDTE